MAAHLAVGSGSTRQTGYLRGMKAGHSIKKYFKKVKIMRKILFFTTLLACILTSSAWAADLSGIWALKMQGPMGDESFDITIKADGENLTVTAAHQFLQEMTGKGTLKGDAINFNLKATGSLPVEFAYTGKVAGTKMDGTLDISGFEGIASATGGQAQGSAGDGGQSAKKTWSAEKK
jgi:hypothetical protein